MFKKVYPYSEISDKIKEAIDLIADPIKQTMSPLGGNVVFEDDTGKQSVTNDGKTIAKYISVSDPIMDNVISIIKTAAMKTDQQAGDGTSTTICWASVLTKGGLKLLEDGYNPMILKREFDRFSEAMKEELNKQIRKVENDDDKFFIANISANNDKAVAEDVVKIVNAAGEDGLVFFVEQEGDTRIVEDTGFNIESGLVHPALSTNPSGMSSAMIDCPVLITDKRIYYQAEAEAILSTVLNAGYKKVCIVARDFIGEALPYFIANHQRGNIQTILVRDPNVSESNSSTLDDLAVYLGGRVVSDKVGKLVDNLTFSDFVLAKKAFADGVKCIISRDKDKPGVLLQARIQGLKEEIEKKPANEEQLKKRVASLTNGMVTVYIGGRTPMEVREKAYRYEDAVNATRQAMKHGYLPGGGVAMFNAWNNLKYQCDPAFSKIFSSVCEFNIRQIAINCGKDPQGIIDTLMSKEHGLGYNAMTGKIEDVVESGIIDPAVVTLRALDNATSVANVIVSSRYLIINDREWQEKQNQIRNPNIR